MPSLVNLHLEGKSQTLQANISLDWRCMTTLHPLAYYAVDHIMAHIRYDSSASGVDIINQFFAIDSVVK
jgi:hypothetical protein